MAPIAPTRELKSQSQPVRSASAMKPAAATVSYEPPKVISFPLDRMSTDPVTLAGNFEGPDPAIND